MKCTGCGIEIARDSKFIFVWKTPDGFRLAVGCAHYTPEGTPDFIFGGAYCWRVWIGSFERSLMVCDHTKQRTAI